MFVWLLSSVEVAWVANRISLKYICFVLQQRNSVAINATNALPHGMWVMIDRAGFVDQHCHFITDIPLAAKSK